MQGSRAFFWGASTQNSYLPAGMLVREKVPSDLVANWWSKGVWVVVRGVERSWMVRAARIGFPAAVFRVPEMVAAVKEPQGI
jgi:hypothetical protein